MGQRVWTDTIIGFLLGAVISFMATEFKSWLDRKRTREALSDLLWIELSENRARIAIAANVTDMELNTAVWHGVRVDLVKAGLDGKVAVSLVAAYTLINRWNRMLKEDNYGHIPRDPFREDMIEVLDLAAGDLGPSRNLKKHIAAASPPQ